MTSRMYLAAILVSVVAIGCGGSRIVATIGDEKLTLEEYEETYAKNNGGWEAGVAATLEERERFLDLLVKFRLKVQEGKRLNLMSDTALVNELESYRASVAQTFLVEKELIQPRVRTLYERKKEELRASHILFRVAPDASPKDTLAAYERALRVISLIPKISFDTLAVTYSEDHTATFNRGDIGYFSLGRMVPEFEDASFKLQPGEYTKEPVRTLFGYHIIQLTSRTPNKGSVRVSHILKQFGPGMADSLAVADSVRAIYEQIQAGLAFEAAALQYSDDRGSSFRGGDLGVYERERLPLDLGELLFASPIDSVARPYRASYGYHLFKVTGHQGVASFEQMEKDMRKFYEGQRYEKEYGEYLSSLMSRYRLATNEAAVEHLRAAVDSSVTPLDSAFHGRFDESLQNAVLYSAGAETFRVRDFIAKVEASNEFRGLPLTPKTMDKILFRLSGEFALYIHGKSATERYPDFARLMQEYRDGILLYRVEQDEVWKKVMVNDSVLKVFHDSTKERYRWPDRVNIGEIYVLSDSLAQALYKRVLKGEDFFKLAQDYTVRPGYRDRKGVWGFQAVNLNDLTMKGSAMRVDSVSPSFRYQTGWAIVKSIAKDSARMKTFEEAGPELSSNYQEVASKLREEEWVQGLRRQFPVTVKREVLQEAFTRRHASQ